VIHKNVAFVCNNVVSSLKSVTVLRMNGGKRLRFTHYLTKVSVACMTVSHIVLTIVALTFDTYADYQVVCECVLAVENG